MASSRAPYENYVFKDNCDSQLLFDPIKLKGFVPEEKSELVIYQIPFTATIYDIFDFFDKVGGIFQIKLMIQRDNLHGHNRGLALVTYCNETLAGRAIKNLCKVPFMTYQLLAMEHSLENRPLFLHGIPGTRSQDEIEWAVSSLYRSHILNNLHHIVPGHLSIAKGPIGGLFLIHFDTHYEASQFRAKFRSGLILFGCPIKVDWWCPSENLTGNEGSSKPIMPLRSSAICVAERRLQQSSQVYGSGLGNFNRPATSEGASPIMPAPPSASSGAVRRPQQHQVYCSGLRNKAAILEEASPIMPAPPPASSGAVRRPQQHQVYCSGLRNKAAILEEASPIMPAPPSASSVAERRLQQHKVSCSRLRNKAAILEEAARNTTLAPNDHFVENIQKLWALQQQQVQEDLPPLSHHHPSPIPLPSTIPSEEERTSKQHEGYNQVAEDPACTEYGQRYGQQFYKLD